jgi:predicted DNA-binding transcriptional regulator AlpA
MVIQKKTSPAHAAAAAASASAARLISKPEVLDRVGVTYPTLWAWMRDGKFPRSRELGGKSCWVESEVAEWITSRPVRRLKGDKAA